MIQTILDVLKGFLNSIPILRQYFPPKTPAEREQEIQQKVNAQEQAEDQGAPPKWN